MFPSRLAAEMKKRVTTGDFYASPFRIEQIAIKSSLSIAQKFLFCQVKRSENHVK
jgi:hypothetical protein